mmetsp:Transcript_5054/g.5734  ORF Transcript_5054/g.5734 Transcript_5054/m.5734 type:complete len:485 (+) Transcript_5054:351-1805(+)
MSRSSECNRIKRQLQKELQYRKAQAQAQAQAQWKSAQASNGSQSYYHAGQAGYYSQVQPPKVPSVGITNTQHHSQASYAQAQYYNNPAYAQQYAQYYQAWASSQGQSNVQAGVHDQVEGQVKEASKRKNLVPMKHDSNYNVNTLLAKNIRESKYFKDLFEKTTFAQVVDEIYYKVDHVEPWMQAPSNTPSTAFCLLYKLFTMKMTNKQMNSLLNHGDSPYIRALGFLYLRYTCPPDQLWDWIEPFIKDEELFKPQTGSSQKVTIGNWLQGLLENQKYYRTLLPRIPKKIELDIQVKVLKQVSPGVVARVETQVKSYGKSFHIRSGSIVRARYSEDGKWYDARVEEQGSQPGHWWVTYLPEEKYGNQEEVSEKNIKQANETSNRYNSHDEELRKQILNKQRNNATTSNKRNVSKSISTFKNSISVPFSKRRRPDSPPLLDTKGSKTAEEALKKRGQIGHIEKIDYSKKAKKTENKERNELLARYK